MKLSINMTSLLTFSTCLVMLCLLVYFLGHLWMTSILLDVNMYCRCFSISKLVNWVISDPLVHEGLKNWNSHAWVTHMLVDFIMCLVLLRNRTHDFPMFTNRLSIKPGIQEGGMECRERGEWGECYIPGNVTKHFRECCQTSPGMSPNIPGNVAKHSWECC